MEQVECIHGARYENPSYRHRASSSYQLAVADAGNSAPDNDERTTVAFLH